MRKITILLIITSFLTSCDVLLEVFNTANEVITETPYVPSTSEMAEGLKNALNVGTENSINILGKENGFLNDNSVKIPFPEEIIKVKETLDNLGLSDLTNNFVNEMNKGASKAVIEALPIFKSSITEMTFTDAKNILLGDKNSATNYFKSKTNSKLYDSFKPKVTEVLDKYAINTAYNKMMTAYNKIPFITKLNTDLPDYITNKTMDGLFLKVSNEESKIRDDLGARVNDVLKKIFAYADSQKQ